jgi:YHS domain-containing protein
VSASPRILDPICDMVVDLADARDQGLAIERPEREYAFCSHACLVTFAKSPQSYIGKVTAWLDAGTRPEHAHPPMGTEAMPAIDAGMRDWYKSCRCCLSDAHPDVVKILDAEKATPTGL